MAKNILLTGGAGFIGSHLCDRLLEKGCNVRVLDALVAQVHGPERARPAALSEDAELIVADVRDRRSVDRALRGIDAVVHLAAAVGVGQSMYQIDDYTTTNCSGTAVLLEALVERPVERLVVASSMSIYGEGLYRDENGAEREVAGRSLEQLRSGRWEPRDENGRPLEPIPTPETKRPAASSVYALSKLYQEELALCVGRARNLPVVALRFFNAYGPRQALSNPYTGVLAIFASRYLNGKPPLVFEDGHQRRDFVSVHDVARACELALEEPRAVGQVLNIASGHVATVLEVARSLAYALGADDIEPEITGKYRVGDVRHCFADTTRARELLGFEAQVTLQEGLVELTQWLESERPPAADHVDEARAELVTRGLAL
jgi:dTDP-L-rhamnose 4-epimerase